MAGLVLLNVVAVTVALLAARTMLPRARTSLALLAGLSGFVIVVHTAMLAAGLAGCLTAGGVSIVLAIALAVSGWAAWRGGHVQWDSQRGAIRWHALRVPRGGAGRPGGASEPWPMHEGLRPPHESAARRRDERAVEMRLTVSEAFVPLLAVVVGVVWAWPHVFEATRLWIWDDYTYHMVYPMLWLGHHAIAAPPPVETFTMQAWYPLSASVVASWFMLPFAAASRGEALAWVSITGLLYAAIVVSAMAELLARLGCRRGAWAVSAVVLLTSHRVGIMASSFSDADLAQAAALFAALVFAIPRGEEESPRDLRADAWYAALLTGFAIGVKVSAMPVAVIVMLAVVLRAGWRRALPIALVFVAAWSVTGAYWYARNAWHTGNPLYPAAFLVWPGVTFPRTTLREYSAQWGFARAVRDALAVYLNWPLAHAALAIAGLTGLVVRRPRIRTRRYFAIAALVVTAVMLIVLPSAPYSAGNGMTFVSGFVHWDSMRYVALLPLLGWAALAFLLDAGAGASRWRTVAAIAATSGAVLAASASVRTGLTMLGVAVVAAGLVALAGSAWQRSRATIGRAAGATAVVIVAMIVLAWHGTKARSTADFIHREPLFGAAASVLDREPPGTRVAVFGDQWIYPAFGERAHLRPLRLDANGVEASQPIGGEMSQGPVAVDAATFQANLRASGATLVVIVHMPHPGRAPVWPTQRAPLTSMPDASRIYEDRAVSVWRLDSVAR